MAIKKKAQSSIEFTLLMGFMFLTFNVFLLVVANKVVDMQNQKDMQIIDDLSYVVKSEITLAAGVEDNYSRTFEIPKTLKGVNYSIKLISSDIMGTNYSELVLRYVNFTKSHETVKILPKNVNGIIHKGENNITKRNGSICLNIC